MYREILEKFARCFGLNLRFYKKPSSKFPSSLEPICLKMDGKDSLLVKSLTYVCLEKTRESSKKFAGKNNLTVSTLSFHNDAGFWQWSARGEGCEEASKNYVEGLILDESLEVMIVASSRLGMDNIGKSFPRSSLEELLLFLDLHSQTD